MLLFFVLLVSSQVVFGRIVVNNGEQDSVIGSNSIIESNRVPQLLPWQLRQNEVCDMCKLAVEELAAYISNPDNVKNIEALLKNYVCKNAGPLEETCDTLADDLEAVVHLLQPMLQNPGEVCAEISICTTTSESKYDLQMAKRFGILMLRNFIPREAENAVSDVLCEECEFMVGEAKQLFDDKATQGEIKSTVEQLCNYCPQVAGCKKFIDDNIAAIFKEIDDLLSNSKAVCSDIGLCSQTENYNGYYLVGKIDETHPELRTRTVALVNHIQNTDFIQRAAFIFTNMQSKFGVSGGCIACEIGFDTILNIVRYSNSSRYGMVNLIEDICTIFPTDIMDQCNDFVATYGPAVVDLTLRTLNGKDICGDIHACTTNDKRLIVESVARNLNPQCEVCYAILDFIKLEIKNENVQNQIITTLEQICQLVKYKNEDESIQCISYIRSYAPSVIYMYSSLINPDIQCKELKLCSARIEA